LKENTMSRKSLFTGSGLFRQVYKPSIALIFLLSATFIPTRKSLADYYNVNGYTDGETAGYSEVRSNLQVPNGNLYDGEYIRAYTEIRDSSTRVKMAAGAIQICQSGGCIYAPSATWYTVANGASSFDDYSIPLNPGAVYGFRVNYQSGGAWVSQIRFSNGDYSIYVKNLSLSRPMDTVSAGAQANYFGIGVGRLTNTKYNSYRLGGTNSIRSYIYTKKARNVSVSGLDIGPPIGDPYYEWFVTGS
jgi:hypothetical protein